MFTNLPFNSNERAVSPVIGVILMVAITVILAAVIGTFVLGLGDQVSQTAPQASITTQDFDTNLNTVTFEHDGGDSLDSTQTEIVVSGDSSGTTNRLTSSTSNEFGPADTFTMNLGNTSAVTITSGWNNGNWNSDASSGIDISATDITVTFVDNPSGQVIAEKSIDSA